MIIFTIKGDWYVTEMALISKMVASNKLLTTMLQDILGQGLMRMCINIQKSN